jgi:methionine synthase I (cobalamin-dependent)
MLQAVSHPFLLVLEKDALLRDGGMGTLLHERGVPLSACLEAVNLESPDLACAIRREYVEAGAEIIETNTFGVTGLLLNRHGLAGRVKQVNRRAVEIARGAAGEAGRSVFVVGAAIVGGCRGTTPEHIDAMRAVLSGATAEPAAPQAHQP